MEGERDRGDKHRSTLGILLLGSLLEVVDGETFSG